MRAVPGWILFGLLVGVIAPVAVSGHDRGGIVPLLLGGALIAIGSLLRRARASRAS